MASVITTAEIAAFDYVNAGLNGGAVGAAAALNVTAFRDEYPDSFADEDNNYEWTLYFEGGGDNSEETNIGSGPDTDCDLVGRLVWDGVFETKADAWTKAQAVKELFPVMHDSTGTPLSAYDPTGLITVIKVTTNPMISRVSVRRNPDQDNAGELRVWRMVIEMEMRISMQV